MADSGEARLAGRVAFTYPAFVLYEVARFFTVVAMEMQSVAVGWQIYEITHRALDLGIRGAGAIPSWHFAVSWFRGTRRTGSIAENF